MKCKTMDTTRTKRAPSWLRSGRGGALSAAFHKKSTFILAGLVLRVSRADLRQFRQVVNVSVPFETALISDGVHY